MVYYKVIMIESIFLGTILGGFLGFVGYLFFE